MSYPITPAEALEKLADLKREEERNWTQQLETVRAARHQGCSWDQIAAALGTTRQNAWAKWSSFSPV